MEPFASLESNVRTYCRTFPVLFTRAEGCHLIDESGRRYLDFWCGAGALNYGHNPPRMRQQLIAYLSDGGILHSLDLATAAKRDFLERFRRVILEPRGMRHRVQFTGPTGANAVEAALKLARKVTGRTGVVCFTNAYHGVTLGALAMTSNAGKRAGAGLPLHDAVRMPFDGYCGPEVDTLDYVEAMLAPGSGVEPPAAFIVETVQAEGGVNVASARWLRRLQAIAAARGSLLVVDDIQAGCGRTGPFFSFEEAGLEPDLVCLSKSISGCGLPMALLLLRPELDVWSPGEHNGTFRGNNLAFVAGAEALAYWENDELSLEVRRKGEVARARLEEIAAWLPGGEARVTGRGLLLGLGFTDAALARQVSEASFRRGLVAETAGSADQVLKVMPPLVIEDGLLREGLDLVAASVDEVLSCRRPVGAATGEPARRSAAGGAAGPTPRAARSAGRPGQPAGQEARSRPGRPA